MSEHQNAPQVRWRYFIDKKFQNIFILRFSAIVVFAVVITLGLLWLIGENPYPFLNEQGGLLFSVNTEKMLNCQNPDGSVFQIPTLLRPYNAFQLFWKPIVFVSGMNLVLIALFSIFFSHSMAGPVHNIRKSLQEMASGGQIRPIRVRKGDQFQNLVDDINLLIEKRVK